MKKAIGEPEGNYLKEVNRLHKGNVGKFTIGKKMTGGTPEVRSDKSLTSMTFNIRHSSNGPMDQWTNGLMD